MKSRHLRRLLRELVLAIGAVRCPTGSEPMPGRIGRNSRLGRT
jgi:hypothetical protein